MQYKQSKKIIIDKRKLDTLIRLNCPDDRLLSIIKTGKFEPTKDELLDETLESLFDIKEFQNWGGSRPNSGRKQSKINQLENQDENQDENQLANQVVDKDKDKDKDNSKYYFERDIIKLTKKDFDNWQKAYPELNLYAECIMRDDYLKTLPANEQKNWFVSTSRYFVNQNEFRKKQHAEKESSDGWVF